jgi:hypothetical protein
LCGATTGYLPAFGLADAEQRSAMGRRWRAKVMNITPKIKALYCGVEVELIYQMNHCSLVRFKERSFVVDTADLVLEQDFKETTKNANSAKAA